MFKSLVLCGLIKSRIVARGMGLYDVVVSYCSKFFGEGMICLKSLHVCSHFLSSPTVPEKVSDLLTTWVLLQAGNLQWKKGSGPGGYKVMSFSNLFPFFLQDCAECHSANATDADADAAGPAPRCPAPGCSSPSSSTGGFCSSY